MERLQETINNCIDKGLSVKVTHRGEKVDVCVLDNYRNNISVTLEKDKAKTDYLSDIIVYLSGEIETKHARSKLYKEIV